MLLEDFKKDCLKYKSDVLVQRVLIENSSFFFDEIQLDKEYDFKKDIATILQVHIRDIVIVGSGKLGFSLKPDDSNEGLFLFKKFDYKFNNNLSQEKSDLDIAIVSSLLFDKELKNLYDHTNYYKSTWKDRNVFAKYVLKGRLAIRFLPNDFQLTKGVINVQEKYQREYDRKVNIEIYKSWHFFETYHQENIKHIQINLLK